MSSRLTPDALLAHCLSEPDAWQDEPWEGDVVAKVGDKIFAFLTSATIVAKLPKTRRPIA